MAVLRHLSEISDQELRDRRANERDRFDEVWNGVLHMNPSPSFDHQRIALRLATIFVPLADEVDLEVVIQLDVLDPDELDLNYRQPDVSIVRREHAVRRGIVGPCELVVEVRSPRDETYLKFDFYAGSGAKQLLVIEPATRTAELYQLVDDRYQIVEPDADGRLTIDALPVSFETVDGESGPVLRITWPDGAYDI